MLSIGKIALGQHRYYEQQVAAGADDYYSGRGEAPGEWAGREAEALGLAGRVGAGQFSALLAGSDPRSPGTRLRSSERDPKIAAFDLTFSAPKSVSVLFATAPERVAGVLVGCHEEAVGAALDYLQDTAVAVRRGHGGLHHEDAGGLIAAAYRHRMSRALDPQLHTHVVAANLARGSDDRYTSLHSPLLYRAAKTAGTLYQAHVRALISERLGLEWGEVHKGASELVGIEAGVIEHFSQRRHEMRRAAEAEGISLNSKRGWEAAALASRERKQYGLETHTWREEVRARAAEHGLDAGRIRALLDGGRERSNRGLARASLVDDRAIGDLLAGPAGLTDRVNTFDDLPVLQGLASATRSGARVADVRAQAMRFTERADIIPTQAGAMTTAELIACERRLIAAAIERAGEGAPAVEADTIEETIATADRALTDEQTRAVRAVLSGADGVSVIQALAGTGKTYTAGVLRAGYERAGYEVIGAAPTGRAARELAEDAAVAARTLDRLLLEVEQNPGALPEGGVLILDEAGMAPTRLTARLLDAAQQSHVKVIAIGDPGQLSSVQAGGWLAAVGDRLGTVRLNEVIRQRDPAERAALASLHDRRPEKYMEWAGREGRILTATSPGSGVRDAVAQWREASDRLGAAQAVMIVRDNDLRETLNEAARTIQNERGLLGEEMNYGTIDLSPGDRVICRSNDSQLDVDNGTRGTVLAVNEHAVTISTDAGVVRELPSAYVKEHLELAYALTGHGMQGGTVEHAVVLAAPHDLTAGWSYTALSRARGKSTLLIYDERFEDTRAELAPRGPLAANTPEELITRATHRMRERDDEDLAIEQLTPTHPADRSDTSDEVRRPVVVGRDGQMATNGESDERQLAEARGTLEDLRTRLQSLATRELQRLEDLDDRLTTLKSQRTALVERLGSLEEPRRRFGRRSDQHAVERASISGSIDAADREIHATQQQRGDLARRLGDPLAIQTERLEIREEIDRGTSELHRLRDALAERQVQSPGQWATNVLGERPDAPGRASRTWEEGIRQAARYRLQYGITSDELALGDKPPDREQARDWQRSDAALSHAGERLGRSHTHERSPSIDR